MRIWRLSVAFIGPKSRTERPRKTKIDTEVAHVTRDSDTTFKVKRSKVNLQGRGHIVAASRTSCFIGQESCRWCCAYNISSQMYLRCFDSVKSAGFCRLHLLSILCKLVWFQLHLQKPLSPKYRKIRSSKLTMLLCNAGELYEMQAVLCKDNVTCT